MKLNKSQSRVMRLAESNPYGRVAVIEKRESAAAAALARRGLLRLVSVDSSVVYGRRGKGETVVEAVYEMDTPKHTQEG